MESQLFVFSIFAPRTLNTACANHRPTLTQCYFMSSGVSQGSSMACSTWDLRTLTLTGYVASSQIRGTQSLLNIEASNYNLLGLLKYSVSLLLTSIQKLFRLHSGLSKYSVFFSSYSTPRTPLLLYHFHYGKKAIESLHLTLSEPFCSRCHANECIEVLDLVQSWLNHTLAV